MKQVLITLGIVLLVMFGYYWLNMKNPTEKVDDKAKEIMDKQIYFEKGSDFLVDQETEVKLMARDNQNKIVGYWIEFSYDSAMIKMESVEINKDIFDQKNQVKIDETTGSVKIIASNFKNRNKLSTGEVVLATVKIKNLKKGTTMIYATRKPEVDILVNGKVVGGELEMPNFKINIL